MPNFRLTLNYQLIKRVVRISLPRTLTLSMSSIVFVFLVALASRIEEGSVSILNFANNLQTIPLSLIGVSYSLAAFPTLTRKFQEKNIPAFLESMKTTAQLIIFWSLPFTALMIVLRAQVVRVLLGAGLFDWTATRLTAATVALFIFSTVFQSLLLLLMRGFYSAGHTQKPFYINLVSTGVLLSSTYGLLKLFYSSSTFSYFITSMMKVEAVPGSAILMLPLGFSLGMIFNGLLLWGAFEHEFKGFSRSVSRTFFQGVGTSVIMGAVGHWALNFFNHFFDLETSMGVFLQGLCSGLVAIMAGIIILTLLKSPELAETFNALKSRFWKAQVIATDPEIV